MRICTMRTDFGRTTRFCTIHKFRRTHQDSFVHSATTEFRQQSPDPSQDRVQIVRDAAIESTSDFKCLQRYAAGTSRALCRCVSGGSVGRLKQGLEPDFSKGGTGVQARKLERVGSLIPGKPIRAAARRRWPTARGFWRSEGRGRRGCERHSHVARGENPEELKPTRGADRSRPNPSRPTPHSRRGAKPWRRGRGRWSQVSAFNARRA